MQLNIGKQKDVNRYFFKDFYAVFIWHIWTILIKISHVRFRIKQFC